MGCSLVFSSINSSFCTVDRGSISIFLSLSMLKTLNLTGAYADCWVEVLLFCMGSGCSSSEEEICMGLMTGFVLSIFLSCSLAFLDLMSLLPLFIRNQRVDITMLMTNKPITLIIAQSTKSQRYNKINQVEDRK
jgi:hypothetical protein